jgi:hypothetical protein
MLFHKYYTPYCTCLYTFIWAFHSFWYNPSYPNSKSFNLRECSLHPLQRAESYKDSNTVTSLLVPYRFTFLSKGSLSVFNVRRRGMHCRSPICFLVAAQIKKWMSKPIQYLPILMRIPPLKEHCKRPPERSHLFVLPSLAAKDKEDESIGRFL